MAKLQGIEDGIKKLRLILFKPLLLFLTMLKIRPWFITLFSLVSALISFVFIINRSFYIALFISFMNIFFDMLDGSLARYQGNSSDKGKFLDMTVDSISITLLVLGLTIVSIVNPINGAIFIYLMLITIIFAVFLNNTKIKSDWFFHARAGYLANIPKDIIYFLFVFWVIGLVHMNIINPIMFFLNVYLLLVGAVNFIRIQKLSK